MQQPSSPQDVAPAPPQAPTIPAPVGIGPATSSPSAAEVYQGLKAQHRELANQLENLEDRRRELSGQLQDPMVGGANRKGLEQRITDVDERISGVEQQIAANEAAMARAAAAPGAVELPPPVRHGPPDEAWQLGGLFIVVVLLPLSVAMARRIWRRGVATITSLPAELGERLTRLEQGLDAIAMEVERIGEGQRYLTSRMFADDGSPRALGGGAAEPVEVKARDGEAQYRR